jgi:membrane protease YdiL (CAAX protease family)
MRPIVVLVIATVISEWGLDFVPFNKIPLSHFWQVIIYRVVCIALTFIPLKFLYPASLKRLFSFGGWKETIIVLIIVGALTIPAFFNSGLGKFSIPQISEGLIFSLFIGIDEEFFSRGLIFSAFEEWGIIPAAIISSIHFGLLHLGNFIWGGQGLSYTLAQMLDATAFGLLACAIMLFCKSMWPAILFHGLSDTPMQFQGSLSYSHEVTSSPDWGITLVTALMYLLIASALLMNKMVKVKVPAMNADDLNLN